MGMGPRNTVSKNIDGSNFTKFNPSPKRPDRLWGPPSLLFSSFPAIKESETEIPSLTF
jgi:hypothetical protein